MAYHDPTSRLQQPHDGVGGVVDRPAQAEADMSGTELIGDRAGVWQRLGQAGEVGDHEGLARAAGGECRAGDPGRSRLVPVRPRST